MAALKRKRTSAIITENVSSEYTSMNTTINKINVAFPNYKKFQSKKHQNASVKKFRIEKSHPLMAKCKKNLNMIKKNRVAKQRAHVTEPILPEVKNCLRSYKIPKKSTIVLEDNFNTECSSGQSLNNYVNEVTHVQNKTKNISSSSESNFEVFIKNQKSEDIEDSDPIDSDLEIYEARKSSARKNILESTKPIEPLKKLSKFRSINTDKKLRKRNKINDSFQKKKSLFRNAIESTNSETGFEKSIKNLITDGSTNEILKNNADFNDETCAQIKMPHFNFSHEEIKKFGTKANCESVIPKIKKSKKSRRSKVSSIASRSHPRKCKVLNKHEIFPPLPIDIDKNEMGMEDRDSDSTIIESYDCTLASNGQSSSHDPKYQERIKSFVDSEVFIPPHSINIAEEEIVSTTQESINKDEINICVKNKTNKLVNSAVQTVDVQLENGCIQNSVKFIENSKISDDSAMQTIPEAQSEDQLCQNTSPIKIGSVCSIGSQIENVANFSDTIFSSKFPLHMPEEEKDDSDIEIIEIVPPHPTHTPSHNSRLKSLQESPMKSTTSPPLLVSNDRVEKPHIIIKDLDILLSSLDKQILTNIINNENAINKEANIFMSSSAHNSSAENVSSGSIPTTSMSKNNSKLRMELKKMYGDIYENKNLDTTRRKDKLIKIKNAVKLIMMADEAISKVYEEVEDQLPSNEAYSLNDQLPRLCSQCSKPAEGICCFCQIEFYCSMECTTKAWYEGHSNSCKRRNP